MGKRRGKPGTDKLIADFYVGSDGKWRWEVSSCSRRLPRYLSSGFNSLSETIDDYLKTIIG